MSSEHMISIPVIPQVSLPKFGVIQALEWCLCSMSMEVWYIWKFGTSTTRHWYGLQQDFWSAIHEFKVYDIHAYDTPIVSTGIRSDSSYRRASLLHVHGSLGNGQRDTGMVYNKTFGLR